jgi:hypothetical protein
MTTLNQLVEFTAFGLGLSASLIPTLFISNLDTKTAALTSFFSYACGMLIYDKGVDKGWIKQPLSPERISFHTSGKFFLGSFAARGLMYVIKRPLSLAASFSINSSVFAACCLQALTIYLLKRTCSDIYEYEEIPSIPELDVDSD